MCCRELSLDDMLADPIVQAVMQADAVDRRELETLLTDVARERAAAAPPAAGIWAVFCRTPSGRSLSR